MQESTAPNSTYNLLISIIIFFTLLIACNILSIIIAGPASLEPQGYQTSEFLINYQGGFIRRGLLGECLYSLHNITKIDPRYVIWSICVVSLLLLLYILIRRSIAKNICWYFLPLSFGLGGADFIRKDYLCMLLILYAICLYKKNKNIIYRFINVNLILIVAINLHECVFFMIIPAFFVLFYSSTQNRTAFKYASMLPCLIMMIMVSIFKGNVHIAQTINNSWIDVYPNFKNIIITENMNFNSITAIGWDTQWAIDFHIHENFFKKTTLAYGLLTKPINWILIIYAVNNIIFINKPVSRLNNFSNTHCFLGIMIFQFFSILPMLTILSCDASRVYFYWATTSLIIYLYIPQTQIELAFPNWYKKVISYIHPYVYNRKSIFITTLFVFGDIIRYCIPRYKDFIIDITASIY